MRVVALVLAAGRSRRMGRPKPLLPWAHSGATTAIGAILRTLDEAGLREVRVVLGPDFFPVAAAGGVPLARVVVNPDPDAGGPIASLNLALDAIGGDPVDGALVWPADHPGVSAALLRRLLDRFARGRPPIVRPTVRGRGGHPAIFSAAVFPEIRRAPVDEGARAVVRAHRSDEALVETDEEAAVRDLDTPEDYATAAPR